jgi:protein FAM50
VKLGKNPNLDTSFLPDKDRDEQDKALKTKLVMEFHEMQEKRKSK